MIVNLKKKWKHINQKFINKLINLKLVNRKSQQHWSHLLKRKDTHKSKKTRLITRLVTMKLPNTRSLMLLNTLKQL